MTKKDRFINDIELHCLDPHQRGLPHKILFWGQQLLEAGAQTTKTADRNMRKAINELSALLAQCSQNLRLNFKCDKSGAQVGIEGPRGTYWVPPAE